MTSIPTEKEALEHIKENYRDQDERASTDSYENKEVHYNTKEEEEQSGENVYEEEVQDEDESKESDKEEKNDDEYVTLKLSKVYKNISCPICLGILKNTRAITECMHRFCRECIDQLMETGNQECPVCKVQVPNQRVLRDDANYDRIVSILCAEMNKYENESQSSVVATIQGQEVAHTNKPGTSGSKSTTTKRTHAQYQQGESRVNYEDRENIAKGTTSKVINHPASNIQLTVDMGSSPNISPSSSTARVVGGQNKK